jgi:hypothetical protein
MDFRSPRGNGALWNPHGGERRWRRAATRGSSTLPCANAGSGLQHRQAVLLTLSALAPPLQHPLNSALHSAPAQNRGQKKQKTAHTVPQHNSIASIIIGSSHLCFPSGFLVWCAFGASLNVSWCGGTKQQQQQQQAAQCAVRADTDTQHGQITHEQEGEDAQRCSVGALRAAAITVPPAVCRCCTRPACLCSLARALGLAIVCSTLTPSVVVYVCICPFLCFGVQSTARKSVPHTHSASYTAATAAACPTSRPGNERIARKQGLRENVYTAAL